MTTYFGLCDAAGNPTSATAGNTGAAETDWNNAIIFTCPGTGTQVVNEISANLKNVTNYNIRLAIFNTAGTTKLAEGTAAVAIVGAADSWQGHIGQANITPNPANLVGGTNYIIAITSSGDTQSNHCSNVGGTDGRFNASDLTAGFGASLPAGTDAPLVFPVRAGVQAPVSGAVPPSQSSPSRRMVSWTRGTA